MYIIPYMTVMDSGRGSFSGYSGTKFLGSLSDVKDWIKSNCGVNHALELINNKGVTQDILPVFYQKMSDSSYKAKFNYLDEDNEIVLWESDKEDE